MAATLRTDIGKRRAQNEDAAWFDEKLGMYAVADGMGGHQAGEVASQMAIDAVMELARTQRKPSVAALKAAITGANEAIFRCAESNAACQGMGTTLSMLWRSSGQMYIAHVGDSRIYRLRGRALEQLTRDHSLVEELVQANLITKEQARTHAKRNIITRALGTPGDNAPDIHVTDIQRGDLFLLCTDGLSGMVDDETIEKTLCDYPLEAAADRLIDLALEAGGSDNVTLILAGEKEA